jgi:hypothetical protein
MTKSDSERFNLTVIEDGNRFHIEWDAADSITSKLNDWTEEDWILAIRTGVEDELLMLIEEECAEN